MPEEIIASTLLFARYFLKYFTDGFIQNFRASGIKKLPLNQIDILSVNLGFFPSDKNPELTFSPSFCLLNFL